MFASLCIGDNHRAVLEHYLNYSMFIWLLLVSLSVHMLITSLSDIWIQLTWHVFISDIC